MNKTMHILDLPAFTPPSVNKAMFASVKQRSRIQRGTRDIIGCEARRQGIPLATCKRRLSLVVTLGKGQRKLDRSNVFKVVEDALVCTGLLVDDTDRWVEHGNVTWERGERRTQVLLEDLKHDRE